MMENPELEFRSEESRSVKNTEYLGMFNFCLELLSQLAQKAVRTL